MIEIHIGDDKKITAEKKGGELIIDGEKSALEIVQLDEYKFRVFSDSKIYTVDIIDKKDKEIIVSIDGQVIPLRVVDEIDQILQKLGMNVSTSDSVKEIKAPMPGNILSLATKPGSEVNKGDAILILEAMKMENVIKSPRDGKISAVHVNTGDNVEKNQILISFE